MRVNKKYLEEYVGPPLVVLLIVAVFTGICLLAKAYEDKKLQRKEQEECNKLIVEGWSYTRGPNNTAIWSKKIGDETIYFANGRLLHSCPSSIERFLK